MELTDLLDQIDRLELEIYPGPWVANDRGIGYEITTQHQIDEAAEVNGWPMPINSGIKDTFPRSDAEFIALARTALPKLAEAVYQVLELIDAEEKRNKYQHVMFDGTPFPPAVSTNEVRQAITDAMEDQ